MHFVAKMIFLQKICLWFRADDATNWNFICILLRSRCHLMFLKPVHFQLQPSTFTIAKQSFAFLEIRSNRKRCWLNIIIPSSHFESFQVFHRDFDLSWAFKFATNFYSKFFQENNVYWIAHAFYHFNKCGDEKKIKFSGI